MKASNKTAADLAALADMPDSGIDTSDIPESADWTGAIRGKFHRRGALSRSGVSLKRMSDQQKAEIHKLLLQGMSRYDIAEQVGVTPGQVSAIRAWITMRTPTDLPAPNNAESDEIVEAVETTFGLERDLRHTLRRNIALLEPGLTIVDGGGERKVKSGGRNRHPGEGSFRRDGRNRAKGGSCGSGRYRTNSCLHWRTDGGSHFAAGNSRRR